MSNYQLYELFWAMIDAEFTELRQYEYRLLLDNYPHGSYTSDLDHQIFGDGT